MVVNYGPDLDYWTFLDSNLHTRLAIVTENELELAFPPRNLSSRSVHVLFSYRGNKQTDRQTNAGKNIIPRFRGDNKHRDTELSLLTLLAVNLSSQLNSILYTQQTVKQQKSVR